MLNFNNMDKEQVKEYSSKVWKHKREEILRRDNYKCTNCGATKEDGVKLDVHHRCYFKNTKPYDYPDSMLYTLCAKCHMEEHGKIMPTSGWEYVYWEDTEEFGSEQCERCDSDLRYVHTLYHPNWGYIRVGCSCADSLMENKIASEKELELRNLSSKLRRFIDSPKWKKRKNGYIYSNEIQIWENHSDDFVLVYKPIFAGKYYDYKKINGFKTLNEAKYRAFELYNDCSLTEEKITTSKKYLILPEDRFERIDALKFICFDCINNNKKIIRPSYVVQNSSKTIDATELNCNKVSKNRFDKEWDYDLVVDIVGKNEKHYEIFVKLIFEEGLPELQSDIIKKSMVNYITIDCSFLMKHDNFTIEDIYNELYNENSYKKYKWLSCPDYDNYFRQKKI